MLDFTFFLLFCYFVAAMVGSFFGIRLAQKYDEYRFKKKWRVDIVGGDIDDLDGTLYRFDTDTNTIYLNQEDVPDDLDCEGDSR